MKHLLPSAAAALALFAPTVAAQQPVTDEPLVRRELGAANFVPADCALFSTTLRAGEQWQQLRDSNAWRELAALPGVVMALTALHTSPAWRHFTDLRDESERFDAAVDLFGDALSHEVFVCFDAKWVDLVRQAGAAYVEALLARTLQSANPGPRLLDGLLELEMPGVLLGCRVGDRERVDDLLAFAVRELGQLLPMPIEQRELGTGTFFVLELRPDHVPSSVRALWRDELRGAGIDADRVARFDRWFDARRLSLAVGRRDDHLLFAVGADTRQLERLGRQGCLADSAALAPARAVLKPGTVSLQYVCPELSARQPVPRELADLVVTMLQGSGTTLPDGLLSRLDTDLHALLDEFAAGYGPARAEVAIAFSNRGVESYSFVAEQPGVLDSSKPLASLAHGGAAPLLLAASRTTSALPDYARFVHWLRVGYGYFTDHVEPRLSSRDRQGHAQFRDAVLPFLTRIDAIARAQLLPALDGGESLVVLDGAGRLDAADGLRFEPALRWPRPALVQELAAGHELNAALQECHAAFDELLGALTTGRMRLPKPSGQDFGKFVRYALPEPAPGVKPTALVSATHAVIAWDDAAARALLTASRPLRSEVVDFTARAGAALHVDLGAVLTMLLDDAMALTTTLHRAGRLDEHSRSFLRAHLPGLRRALAAVRSYSSRTWTENGLQITHSWLHVEDIPR